MSTLNPVHVRAFAQQIANRFDQKCIAPDYDYIPVGWEDFDPDVLRFYLAANDISCKHQVSDLLPKLEKNHYEDWTEGFKRRDEVNRSIAEGLEEWDISSNPIETLQGLSHYKYFTHVFTNTWLSFKKEEKEKIIQQLTEQGMINYWGLDRVDQARGYQWAHLSRRLREIKKLLLGLSWTVGPSLSLKLQTVMVPRVVAFSKRFVETYTSVNTKVKGELAYQTAMKVANYITSTGVWKILSYQIFGLISILGLLSYLYIFPRLSQASPIFPAIYYTYYCDVISLLDLAISQFISPRAEMLHESLLKNIQDQKERASAIKAYEVFMACVNNYPPEPSV